MLEFIKKLIELFFGKPTTEETSAVEEKQEVIVEQKQEVEEDIKMISMKEILKNVKLEDLPVEHQNNLYILHERINKIRNLWGKPMIITSGYRSLSEHLRIYREKGVTDQSKIPMKSRHLSGEALDVSDPKQELQAWCLANTSILEEVGLWCEHFDYSPNWCHFQIVPPKSGKRFFMP